MEKEQLPMKEQRIILVTSITFVIYFVLDALYFKDFRALVNQEIPSWGLSQIITYAVSGIPIYIGVYLLSINKSWLNKIGFTKSPLKDFHFPLLATVPMFLGFALLFNYNYSMTSDEFLVQVLAAAFFEELFLRGFLFGVLFRFTKLGFLPAVLAGAILFGLSHLYQSNDVLEAFGIFGITFLGGILFAWLFAEWEYNLWIPIYLHFFMNLASLMFSATDNALGGIMFNILRFSTVALIVFFTVSKKRKQGKPFEVRKATIWMKKPDQTSDFH